MDEEYFIANFNTPLPTDKFYQFLKWAVEKSDIVGRDLLEDMRSYDLQGAWLSGAAKGLVKGGHLPDTYKKPNHITFSNESIYHGKEWQGGQWQQEGKKWRYTPGQTTLKLHGPKRLKEYFQNSEPDSELIIPED